MEIDKGRNVRAPGRTPSSGGSRGVFHPVGRLAIDITTAPPGRVVVSASLESTSPLPRMPLAVITHGGLRYPPGSLDAAQEQQWQQLQDELAAMQPDSTHVIATGSGHDIQHEQPELVLAQLRRVVAAVRAG